MAAPAIVSASRRTDIPAFLPGWFSDCLERGLARFRNPFSGKPASVPLDRESVAAFVFWTRDPRPFLDVLSTLEREGYPSIFHFTLTGHAGELEPSVPPFREAVAAFRELSAAIGPRRVIWRFDPILPGEPPAEVVARFDRVSESLAGHSARCVVSVAHPYRKSRRATRRFPGIWEPTPGLAAAVETIAALGRSRGFTMQSCCSPPLAAGGIPAGACVDADSLRALYPGARIPASPSPSRAGCLCAASRDIGTYRTCGHGCLYCYAA